MKRREFKKLAKVWNNVDFDQKTIEIIVDKVCDYNFRGLCKYAKMLGLNKGVELFEFVENTRYVGYQDIYVKGLIG